jgi:hypothetical protein
VERAIALYLNVIKRTSKKVLINPIIRTRTRHFRYAYHPTRDNMHTEYASHVHLYVYNLPTFSHSYLCILLLGFMKDIHMDNAFVQGTHGVWHENSND